jgi:hypothetical protein
MPAASSRSGSSPVCCSAIGGTSLEPPRISRYTLGKKIEEYKI